MKLTKKIKEKEISLIKERFKIFYNQYDTIFNDALYLVTVEIRRHIISIENLFSPYGNNRSEKQQEFNLPFSYPQYQYWVDKTKKFRQLNNIDLRDAVKELKIIKNKQKFRNLEVFDLLVKRLYWYKTGLKENYTLKRLCRLNNQAGIKMRIFKERRLKEAEEFYKEIKKTRSIVRSFGIINDLNGYLKMFEDFFVIALKKLENLKIEIDKLVTYQRDTLDIKIIAKKRKLNLQLPSWDLAQDS